MDNLVNQSVCSRGMGRRYSFCRRLDGSRADLSVHGGQISNHSGNLVTKLYSTMNDFSVRNRRMNLPLESHFFECNEWYQKPKLFVMWKSESRSALTLHHLPKHTSHKLGPVSHMTQFFLLTNKEAKTSSHRRLGLQSVLLPSGFPTNMLNVLLVAIFPSSY